MNLRAWKWTSLTNWLVPRTPSRPETTAMFGCRDRKRRDFRRIPLGPRVYIVGMGLQDDGSNHVHITRNESNVVARTIWATHFGGCGPPGLTLEVRGSSGSSELILIDLGWRRVAHTAGLVAFVGRRVCGCVAREAAAQARMNLRASKRTAAHARASSRRCVGRRRVSKPVSTWVQGLC